MAIYIAHTQKLEFSSPVYASEWIHPKGDGTPPTLWSSSSVIVIKLKTQIFVVGHSGQIEKLILDFAEKMEIF